MSSAKQSLTWSLLAVCALTLCMFVSQVSAQDDGASIRVSTAEAYSSSNFNAHILPALTAAGKAVSDRQFGPAFEKAKTQARAHSNGTATVPAPGFYPSDLDWFGGPVVTQMWSHPVYVNASTCGGVANCWGDPAAFLRDLGKSLFIHVTDQYTRTSGDYALGRPVNVTAPTTTNQNGNTVIDQPTLLAIAHDAAFVLGVTSGGYNHEFHIFLPPGIDTCFPRGQRLLLAGQSSHLCLLRVPWQRGVQRYRPCNA